MLRKRGFCEFSKKLYWGNSVKKHTVVKWKLYHGSGQFGIFCITRAANGIDQLEIINSAYLKQPYFRYHPVYIYGIAGGYEEAMDILLRISQEASIAGMDGRLLEYLESVG